MCTEVLDLMALIERCAIGVTTQFSEVGGGVGGGVESGGVGGGVESGGSRRGGFGAVGGEECSSSDSVIVGS